MKKNDIIKIENRTFRILAIEENQVLAIDCEKKSMPQFFPVSFFEKGEIFEHIPSSFLSWDELSPNERKIAQKRYTMIAAAVAVVSDKQKRNAMIDYASKQFSVSKQTLRSFLCTYLIYQDIAALAPKLKEEKALTQDQKNIRWALNKFFYTRNQNSLSTAYTMMLKAKYCDTNGNLVSEYPSFNQFRYFYRKNRKMENFHISRDGLTAYQRNSRPLVADGVQEFAPCIGTTMLDSTICDIYLLNEKGEVAGRPILTAACDANTSMCLGYVLSWQNDTNSLKDLMLNILGDKVSFCKKKGIHITNVQWDVQNQLPGILVTDQGHEYTSQNFEQISELGVTLINLTQLINNSGISICLVGTPESALFFEKEAMLARRSLGLNYEPMEYSDEFQKFCKIILAYSYVQQPTTVDESTLMWLYQHSHGNASIVVSLLHAAQEIAILDGHECLDISSLNIAYEKRMKMLHNYIQPQPIKASLPKKKNSSTDTIAEKADLADNLSIYQIATEAKVSQSDIISLLRQNGLKIEEVAI